MGKEKILGLSWITVLLSAIGYFVYGGIEGLLGVLILSVLFSLATMLSLIPFAGVIVAGLLMAYVIQPWVFQLTGIYTTWLTSLIFWIDIVFGAIATIVVTIAVLAIMSD